MLLAAMKEMTGTPDIVKNRKAFNIQARVFDKFWAKKPLFDAELEHVMKAMQKQYERASGKSKKREHLSQEDRAILQTRNTQDQATARKNETDKETLAR